MLKRTLSIKEAGAGQETSFSLPNSPNTLIGNFPKFIVKRDNQIPSLS